MPSRHAICADDPQPIRRWLAETWNGRAWQLCGSPRTSRTEAGQYIGQLLKGPQPADAYRPVHAYTDHNVIRVWGTPTTVGRTGSRSRVRWSIRALTRWLVFCIGCMCETAWRQRRSVTVPFNAV
ncbi:hypothetical protein GCM10010345_86080 [Streptomyces canarius]|uniref:Transposase n=1 Tax=Streptomyces canarius TaxID=285453 RepID=A0ABQ3DBY4_9ACTN|nr:hypothetical protein GCM10010345_86080 [Streptomyces canarius]